MLLCSLFYQINSQPLVTGRVLWRIGVAFFLTHRSVTLFFIFIYSIKIPILTDLAESSGGEKWPRVRLLEGRQLHLPHPGSRKDDQPLTIKKIYYLRLIAIFHTQWNNKTHNTFDISSALKCSNFDWTSAIGKKWVFLNWKDKNVPCTCVTCVIFTTVFLLHGTSFLGASVSWLRPI